LWVVERDERILGPYATAGQMQQSPTPRGGGVIKDADWMLWVQPEYPPLDFILASLDTAYTEKTQNDYSALTIWGIFSGQHDTMATRGADRYGKPFPMPKGGGIEGMSKVVLMFAFQDRLEMNALVKKAAETCKTMKVDRLLIEAKASGISVAQELRRLYANEDWAVHLINPGNQDKLARLHSVQHLFSEGMVYAPDKSWAEMVIRQVASFPKGKHDDLVDSVSMAMRHLRESGLLIRSEERLADLANEMDFANVRQPPPLYSV
jgi:predicted phage terminase large subunit-like protein